MFFPRDGAEERKLNSISRWLDWIRNPYSIIFLAALAAAVALGLMLPFAALLPIAAADLLLSMAILKKIRGCPSRGLGSYKALGLGVMLIFLVGAVAALAVGKTIGLAVGFDPGAWWLDLARQLVN